MAQQRGLVGRMPNAGAFFHRQAVVREEGLQDRHIVAPGVTDERVELRPARGVERHGQQQAPARLSTRLSSPHAPPCPHMFEDIAGHDQVESPGGKAGR